MPALPVVTSVIRVDYHFYLDTDTNADVRLFWKYTGGPPASADVNTFASDIRSSYNTHMGGLLSSAFALSEIVVTDLNSSTGAVGTNTSSSTGGRAGTANPVNVCLLMNYIIGRRYRGGKPRSYWPFGVAGDLGTVDAWGSSFISSVTSNTTSHFSDYLTFTSGGCSISQHVNVSYYSGFTNYTGSGGRAKVRSNVRTTPQVDNISGFAPSTIIGSQRRRLRA